MKKSLATILIAVCSAAFSFSQDPLTFMHYNLLNYGNFTSYCTASNNNINSKTEHLKTIVAYANPDVFTVNELFCNSNLADKIMDEALNVETDKYKRAEITCVSFAASLTNMLFYNSDKLGLASQSHVETAVRDINIYKLYSKTELGYDPDTVFFHCIVAHLKAGSDWDDAQEREAEVELLLAALSEDYQPGNFFFLGDFNIYRSSEGAFQKLVDNPNADFRFHDPINRIGQWHNDYEYRDVHTQSTHTSSNGCASTGGMDDRFDFILINGNVKYGNRKVAALPSTYKAIGQDGQHFNSSIISSPTNTSVPAHVLSALYYMSDHLPVSMKALAGGNVGIEELPGNLSHLRIINPVEDKLEILLESNIAGNIVLMIYDYTGRLVVSESFVISMGENYLSLPLSNLEKGLYVVKLKTANNRAVAEKVVIGG